MSSFRIVMVCKSMFLPANVKNRYFFYLGVLWLHETLYDGTNNVINKFIELGKKCYLITNNSQTTREEMAGKCKKFGFNLELVSRKS